MPRQNFTEATAILSVFTYQREAILTQLCQLKLNEKVNRMHEKMVTLFQKIFEQGLESEFKSYPPREMATLFTEMAHSVAWSSIFFNGNGNGVSSDNNNNGQNIDQLQDGDEILHQRLEMVFDIFMNGVSK